MELAVHKEKSNLTTVSKTNVRGALQVVPNRVHGITGCHEDTLVLCDTGSSQTWIDQKMLENLKLAEEEVTIHVAGTHGNAPIQSKKVESTLGLTDNMLLTRVLRGH